MRGCILAGGVERISEFGSQGTVQSTRALGRTKRFDDHQGLLKLRDRRLKLSAKIRASREPADYHGPLEARCIAEPSENFREQDLRFIDLRAIQQCLPTLALREIPFLRGKRLHA
ncbi:hypothetical protein D9M72_547120 [compost metagenome]